MNSIDTVKTLITALQSHDMETASNSMSDNFIISGWTPFQLDKEQFLAMQSALVAAMPDFSYNLSDVHETEDGIEALIQVSGTQTGDLVLPLPGLAPIPATGLAIGLPQVRTTCLLKDGQVIAMNVEDVPGGGLAGLLQQVGTELPTIV